MEVKKYNLYVNDSLFLFISLFVFFLPFFQKASVVAEVVIVLLWLMNGGLKKSVAELKRDKNIFLFLLFYLVHVAGLLYTSNFSFAFFDLETKLSFFLFPLLVPALMISNDQFKKLKWVFIGGCFAGVLLCLVIACKNYLSSHRPDDFYYTNYSRFLHPTYFAVYLNLAIIFLLEELIRKWNVYSLLKKIGIIFLCYFFFISIIQISARTASLVAYLSISVFLLIRLKKDSAGMWKYFFSFLLLFSFFLIQHFVLNHASRFTDLEMAIKQEEERMGDPQKKQPEEDNALKLRVKIWKNSFDLVKRNPLFGVGTGDVKDELYKIYVEKKFLRGAKLHLNSHNQFLNTAVALGLIGLLSLLVIFYVGFRVAIRHKDWIYFSFLLIIFLNCMTESLFEKQNGILFFTAFNMLFYLRNKLTIEALPREAEQQTPNA